LCACRSCCCSTGGGHGSKPPGGVGGVCSAEAGHGSSDANIRETNAVADEISLGCEARVKPSQSTCKATVKEAKKKKHSKGQKGQQHEKEKNFFASPGSENKANFENPNQK
jgi:hypothetical protein